MYTMEFWPTGEVSIWFPAVSYYGICPIWCILPVFLPYVAQDMHSAISIICSVCKPSDIPANEKGHIGYAMYHVKYRPWVVGYKYIESAYRLQDVWVRIYHPWCDCDVNDLVWYCQWVIIPIGLRAAPIVWHVHRTIRNLGYLLQGVRFLIGVMLEAT